MHRWVRSVPWLLALLGLAIPLVGSGFVVWQIVALWLAFLGFAWLFGRHLLTTRAQRIITALVALPVLILPLAWWGGWWLIPADLAWLAIEILDRPREPAVRTVCFPARHRWRARPARGMRLPADCGRVRCLTDGPTGGPRFAAFCERFVVHTKGRWAGQRLVLEPWQREFAWEAFEVDPATGLRVYQEVGLGLPRKNGKSLLASAFGHYFLVADGEAEPEVYVVAAARGQAGIALGQARRIGLQSPLLRRHLRIQTHLIECPRNGGLMRALSADAALQHGLNPSANIIDELHAHRDGALYTALTTGTLAREQPFTLWITTAGAVGTFLHEMYRVMETGSGQLEDRGTLRIYRDRVNGTLIWWYGAPDDADVEDPSVWRAANPASWLQDGRELGKEHEDQGRPDELTLARIDREREEASQRLAKTRDIAAWQATMARLDAEQQVARQPRHQRRLEPAEVVAYLRSLPSLWTDSGPEGRQALASALFARLEVEGYKKMRYELTPDARDLGLDAALPAGLEVGAQMGGFGRGERGSASLAHLTIRPRFVLENRTPAPRLWPAMHRKAR